MSAKRHKALRKAAKQVMNDFNEAGALASDDLQFVQTNDKAMQEFREFLRNSDPKTLVDDPRPLFALAKTKTLAHSKNSPSGILKTLKRTAKIQKD